MSKKNFKSVDEKLQLLLINIEKQNEEAKALMIAKKSYEEEKQNNMTEEEKNRKLAFASDRVTSDEHCARKIMDIEGKNRFVFCENELYVYDERNGMFVSQRKNSHTTLFYYLIKNKKYINLFLSVNKAGKEKMDNYGTSSTLQRKVIQFIETLSVNEEWILETQDSSLGYLLFKDGIYNCKKGKFTKGFNDNIVFHCRVPHNFPVRSEENKAYAFKKSFGILFDKDEEDKTNSDRMIISLAVALAGNKQKKFYFCPGRTNAGKSQLVAMLQIAFGNYIGTFNAEVLAIKGRNNTQEEAQANRWALQVRWCLVIISNEVDMEGKLNGSGIKKHSSGIDKLVARNHCKAEVSFMPHYTPFCMLNDIPDICPMDKATEKRLTYIEFPKQFVEKQDMKKDYHEEMNEDLNIIMKKRKFIDGFILLLLDAYKEFQNNGMPEYDQNLKKEWISEQKQGKQVKEAILKNYDETKQNEKVNKNNIVTVADINEFYKSNKKDFSKISLKTFKDQLRQMGLIEKSDGTIRYWEGIKKKSNKSKFDDLDR